MGVVLQQIHYFYFFDFLIKLTLCLCASVAVRLEDFLRSSLNPGIQMFQLFSVKK